VGRLSLAQLRHRSGRSLALLLGVLLAATAFTVLTAASRTSQLRTVGTVADNRPSAATASPASPGPGPARPPVPGPALVPIMAVRNTGRAGGRWRSRNVTWWCGTAPW
jgi:hypothetical protein